ncbi:MAG: twin-arginine translocase TatA/TatE family subunit [Desulfobulbus sp.]|jgi:sec-independent protein translocase protein TatB
MFGIGLPEMIVIFVVALIVVGPDKLPGLAQSLGKGLMELKKTLNQIKQELTEEEDALTSVQRDLHQTADELRERLLDQDPSAWRPATHLPRPEEPQPSTTAAEEQAADEEMIAELEQNSAETAVPEAPEETAASSDGPSGGTSPAEASAADTTRPT